MSDYKIITKEIKTKFGKRNINIYLPSTYDNKTKFPVIYAWDGQNLHDGRYSLSHDSWEVSTSMEELIQEGKTKGYIVVGIYNSKHRTKEYAPAYFKDEMYKSIFAKLFFRPRYDISFSFLNEAIRIVESDYLTNGERYIMGSSYGGNIALWTLANMPEKFKGAGIYSIASEFFNDSYLDFVKNSDINNNHLAYNYMGTAEDMGKDPVGESHKVNELLREKGLKVKHVLGEGLTHTEKAWAKYFPDFIQFIEKNKR